MNPNRRRSPPSPSALPTTPPVKPIPAPRPGSRAAREDAEMFSMYTHLNDRSPSDRPRQADSGADFDKALKDLERSGSSPDQTPARKNNKGKERDQSGMNAPSTANPSHRGHPGPWNVPRIPHHSEPYSSFSRSIPSQGRADASSNWLTPSILMSPPSAAAAREARRAAQAHTDADGINAYESAKQEAIRKQVASGKPPAFDYVVDMEEEARMRSRRLAEMIRIRKRKEKEEEDARGR